MKKFFEKFLYGIAATIALWLGASGQVLMAAGTVAIDGGDSNVSGVDGAVKPENKAVVDGGAASVTSGQQNAPELYETDLEQAILVLDPMGTAGLTIIETDAQSRKIDDQEFEFYSIGPRKVRATTSGSVTAYADRIVLPVSDAGFAGKDDTIRVVGVTGNDGRDLMLIVIDRDVNSGSLVCYAKNGWGTNGFVTNTEHTIATGTTLVRMAKSCSESKAQTSRAHSYPTSEKGCVQNFMLQIEQTEFDRMTKKRVSWDFDDIVDWNMRDYKVVKELTYMFSVGGLDRHLSNEGEDNYTMLGLWWQAGRELEIGHIVLDASGNVVWEDDKDGNQPTLVGETYKYADGTDAVEKVEIDGKDLVRFNKAAFIGNGGSQVKYLIAGANVVEAFDNIKGKQYENKDIVTENNLTIQNFKTSFGTIKLVYDKLFDICGMANAAFMLDKQYLRKVEFQSMTKTQLKLKESGQRNSHGVVLQEVNAVYLQYADAHAQVWLAGRKDVYDYETAGKYDTDAQTHATNHPKKPAPTGNWANHYAADRA